jgi:protein-disulfide isomerase
MKNNGKATVWFAVGFVVIATVVIIVAAVVSSGSLGGAPSSDTPAPAIAAGDWTRGPKDAKVTLIEYGDFQCPACATYETLVKSVLEAYPNDVVFVFRNFPIYTKHPNGGISAQAAEAAGLQGKYWEMHDILYEKQQEWSYVATNRVVADKFDSYARTIGLDLDKFHQDMNSDQVLKKIKGDVDNANSIGVGSTPSFYVNLKPIQSPASLEEFKSIIDNALASS